MAAAHAKRKPTRAERLALVKALLAHAVMQHAMLQQPDLHSDDPSAGLEMPPGDSPAGGPAPLMPGPVQRPMTGRRPTASSAFPFGQPPAGR